MNRNTKDHRCSALSLDPPENALQGIGKQPLALTKQTFAWPCGPI
jgi:hypothetical protein